MSGIHPMRLRADDVMQTDKERRDGKRTRGPSGKRMVMVTGNRDDGVTHDGTRG